MHEGQGAEGLHRHRRVILTINTCDSSYRKSCEAGDCRLNPGRNTMAPRQSEPQCRVDCWRAFYKARGIRPGIWDIPDQRIMQQCQHLLLAWTINVSEKKKKTVRSTRYGRNLTYGPIMRFRMVSKSFTVIDGRWIGVSSECPSLALPWPMGRERVSRNIPTRRFKTNRERR
jgi:hypothetical protein